MSLTPLIYKYNVHEKLGKGCFSSVFKGVHKTNNKEVAIKIESDAAPLNMLKRESKIISYLNKELSPINRWITPTLLWYGRYGDHICMATTFYPKTLASYIESIWTSNKPNAVIEVSLICYQIVELFQYIHGAFILHCDIKPDNFMINDVGKVVLIDFGLACLYVESCDTTKHRKNEQKEHIIGSPKYVSYFLHEGNVPARRDDMISVGYLFATLFKIDLSWQKCDVSDISDTPYPIYHIMHPHNIIRKRLKSPDYIFKDLLYNSLNRNTIHNYLIPYLANVYKLENVETPDYYTLKGIFSTLY